MVRLLARQISSGGTAAAKAAGTGLSYEAGSSFLGATGTVDASFAAGAAIVPSTSAKGTPGAHMETLRAMMAEISELRAAREKQAAMVVTVVQVSQLAEICVTHHSNSN